MVQHECFSIGFTTDDAEATCTDPATCIYLFGMDDQNLTVKMTLSKTQVLIHETHKRIFSITSSSKLRRYLHYACVKDVLILNNLNTKLSLPCLLKVSKNFNFRKKLM